MCCCTLRGYFASQQQKAEFSTAETFTTISNLKELLGFVARTSAAENASNESSETETELFHLLNENGMRSL